MVSLLRYNSNYGGRNVYNNNKIDMVYIAMAFAGKIYVFCSFS